MSSISRGTEKKNFDIFVIGKPGRAIKMVAKIVGNSFPYDYRSCQFHEVISGSTSLPTSKSTIPSGLKSCFGTNISLNIHIVPVAEVLPDEIHDDIPISELIPSVRGDEFDKVNLHRTLLVFSHSMRRLSNLPNDFKSHCHIAGILLKHIISRQEKAAKVGDIADSQVFSRPSSSSPLFDYQIAKKSIGSYFEQNIKDNLFMLQIQAITAPKMSKLSESIPPSPSFDSPILQKPDIPLTADDLLHAFPNLYIFTDTHLLEPLSYDESKQNPFQKIKSFLAFLPFSLSAFSTSSSLDSPPLSSLIFLPHSTAFRPSLPAMSDHSAHAVTDDVLFFPDTCSISPHDVLKCHDRIQAWIAHIVQFMAVAEIGRKRSSAVSVTMPYSPLLATTFHQFQQSSQSLSSLHLNARRSLVQVLGTLFNMFGVSKCLEGYKKKIEILESLHTPTTIAISSPSLSSSTSSSSSSLHALTTSSSSVSSSSSSSFPVPSHSCSLFTSLADLLECQTQLSGAEEHQGSEGGGSVSSSAELVRLLKKLSGVLRVFLSNLTSHLVCGCIMSE
ncbi:hypothetical protein ADUPG1_013517, partial [Aduncisulcus paluster]